MTLHDANGDTLFSGIFDSSEVQYEMKSDKVILSFVKIDKAEFALEKQQEEKRRKKKRKELSANPRDQGGVNY
ncbi:MAG: hypothetical protein ACI837_001209 [Crocinitomicaceae bacterium]|jgi:hypothetical protein